jgi:X-X-X-Leu-X-X-Gly heptad repeat protein
MTDSFSDKQIKQLIKVVNEVVQPLFEPIIDKLNKLGDKLNKLDDKVNKLGDKVNKIETKLEKLEKSFNGYIGKESEIYELKSNDIFSRFLNENNKMYKELSLRLFYSSTKLITDFDGLFLVNYLQHIKPLKTIYNNEDFPNKQIVIIEAKHDLDKKI